LCQAIICRPRVLLLDEPFSGLDTLVKESIAEVLFSYAAAERVAVVLVTHDLTDAVEHAKRVIVLGGGTPAHVVADLTSSEPNALAKIREHLKAAE
jgi:ABC-type nitrate/sulfonate/bicarbonate transport system ATPase subunit